MRLGTDLLLLALCGAVDSLDPIPERRPPGMSSTGSTVLRLDVDGEEAIIERDSFGVPHIFAPTNRSLFVAYGYAVAQDRLWQLELNRRAARGRLSEIFGASTVPADSVARVVGYTDEELDDQFAQLPADAQGIFTAYRDGINRYLEEVVFPDPINRLPFEFHALMFTPAPWQVRDSIAFGIFMTRRFGEIGGRELVNQGVFSDLVQRYGQKQAAGIFNDLRWIDDPDSPVTIPPDGQTAGRAAPAREQPDQLLGSPEPWPDTGLD